MDIRPDPDRLLERIQREETKSQRGKLKLFFGANPGVGKTYAMLEAARQRRKEGVDVIVGVVETHGRVDTEALLEGLELLPRRTVEYKNIPLKEFDLDGALRRHPALILVDELAHTNAPGVRHAKRWQDVEELLDAGIDVYSTLNVQHWESLKDVVAQVTGITVRETVPDTFLRRMHDIELVDISPDDLLRRLKEGKVYLGDQAERAAENFFKPANLVALRELALRHVAERVDEQVLAVRELESPGEVKPVRDRLLVGITASPMSPRLVRATHRLATQLKSEWIVVNVETPANARLSAEDRGRLLDTMRMAEGLGADAVTVSGANVTDTLLRYAFQRNVTKIILGKPARPRWMEWLQGSVVNDMARRCGNIDLYVISGVGAQLASRRPSLKKTPISWRGSLQAAAFVAACTLMNWPLSHVLDRVNLAMIYLLGVMGVAYRLGRTPALVASVLSVLAFDFFFVPPYLTFVVSDSQYALTFGVMLAAGLLISTLAGRLSQQAEAIQEREIRTRLFYKISRELSETPDPDQLVQRAWRRLSEFYDLPILLFVPDTRNGLRVAAGDPLRFALSPEKMAAAEWVYLKGDPAGVGMDTLAGAGALYVPLRGLQKPVGVLAIQPLDPLFFKDPEEFQVLETLANEIGGALESTQMSAAIGRAELQAELGAMGKSPGENRLRLRNFLTENTIVFLKAGLAKEQILRELLARLRLPNPAMVLKEILKREESGATQLGDHLFLPHARVPGIDTLVAVLGITPEGQIWVLFLSPQTDARVHLAFLSALSAFFQQPGRPAELAKRTTAYEVLDYLRHNEG